MSSAVPDSPSRRWWFSSKLFNPSKSAKSRRRSLSEKPPKPSGTFKFNTFLGFKPKKHPSLAIQDPPPVPVYPVQPPQPVTRPQVRQTASLYTNRPPSNSVSSTLQSSLEPRTPSDVPREPLPFRHSLLTLSDSDPFASLGLSPTIPSKLSRKSDPSTAEHTSKSLVLSDSYTPAFSQSAIDIQTTLPSSGWPSEFSDGPSTRLNKLDGQDNVVSMSQDNSTTGAQLLDNVNQESTPQPRIRTLSKSGSSSTLTDSQRVPDSTTSALPSRARSTADVYSTPPSRDDPKPHKSVSLGALSSSGHSTVVSSRPHIVRQMSASRLGKPPFAPPAHHLPPPPVDNPSIEDLSSIVPADVTTPSSSILSFSSSLDPGHDDPFLHVFGLPSEVKEANYAPIPNLPTAHKETKDSPKSLLSKASTSASLLPPADIGVLTRTVKKAASHQSFSSKHGSTSSTCTPPEEGSDKHPRKQRSFHHHPRLHQSHRNVVPQNPPNFTSFASHMDSNEIADKRRGSTSGASTPSRKRLFSAASLRRSVTSQGEQREADVTSVLSLPLESERPQGTFSPTSMSSTTSSLHGFVGDEPAPPPGSPEYVPQQIMSPAEMLRLEASLEAGTDDYLVKRQRSVPSPSTSTTYPSDMFSDYSFPGGLSPPSSTRPSVEQSSVVTHSGRKGHASRRSLSMKSNERSSSCVSPRPSTSHMYMTPPTSPVTSSLLLSPASPERKPVSLPPPPRSRHPRPAMQLDRLSVVPLIPLSPPPARKNVHTKPSLESVVLSRSIMRKPSFLEIEDEMDRYGDRRLDDSFLDLNRESFDTVRSMSEPGGLFGEPSVS